MKSWALGIASVLVSVVAGTTLAETIGVSLQASPGSSSPYSVGISSGLNVTANLGGGNIVSYGKAGAFRWQVTSDNSPGTFSTYVDADGNAGNGYVPFYTFCIQLFQNTGSPYTVANLSSTPNAAPLGGADAGVMDPGAAAQVQGLVNKFWSAIDFNNSVGANYSFNSISYSDNEVAAAFGLSVWEIEYDGGTTPLGESYNNANGTNYFGSGKLTATGTGSAQNAINLANAWLNSTVWSSSSNITSLALESGSYQDQLFAIPNPPSGQTNPTPLPASLPAGLGLIAGLALYRKFRKSRA